VSQEYLHPPGTPPIYRIDPRQLVAYLLRGLLEPITQEVVVALLGERRPTWQEPIEKPLPIENLRFRKFVAVREPTHANHATANVWAYELTAWPNGFNPMCLAPIGFAEVVKDRWLGVPTLKVLEAQDRAEAALRELQRTRLDLANERALAVSTFSLDDLPPKP